MGYLDIFKKKVRNPKKYVKGKKVGHKAVKTQMRKRKQLKEAGKTNKPKKKTRKTPLRPASKGAIRKEEGRLKTPKSKLQRKKKKLGDILNRLKK